MIRSAAIPGLLARAVLCLLRPRQCPSCRRRIGPDQRLCRACAGRLSRELQRPLRLRLRSGAGAETPVADLRLTAIGPYRGVWGRIIRAYKEDPDPMVAEVVLPRMIACVTGRTRRSLPPARPVPILVPVPMGRVRRRQRGFNPPERLAEALARSLGWDFCPQALRRTRYRRPLRGLSSAQRRLEMADAFEAGDSSRLGGREVILVDDVVTTGSTLRSAAAALRRAGVPVGRAWCLGRTPRRRTKPRREVPPVARMY